CFIIAPPFRRHGIASALLDRVITDAPGRGASWIEAYPRNAPEDRDAAFFRGPRSMYDARGFEPIETPTRDTAMHLRPTPKADGHATVFDAGSLPPAALRPRQRL